MINKMLQNCYFDDYRLRNEITLIEIAELSGLHFSRVKKILYTKTQITCEESNQLTSVFMEKYSEEMSKFLEIGRQKMGCPYCKN